MSAKSLNQAFAILIISFGLNINFSMTPPSKCSNNKNKPYLNKNYPSIFTVKQK